MIQITTGTFGYYNGRKVIPITSADGPQKFDPELEARLVKQGVAKYVDGAAATIPPEDPKDPDPAGGNQPQDPGQADAGQQDEAKPEYSDDMRLDELKEIAAGYGVDASAMRKKADVIKAIEAAKAAEQQADDDGDDDEEPPQPGVADPV